MADIVFKIVAVLMALGGFASAALMFMAIAMGGVTNRTEAERSLPWLLVPLGVGAVGIFLCFKAF